MIPLWLTIRVRAPGTRGFRLDLPLFLIWLLIAPLILLAAAVLMIAAPFYRLNPLAALAGFCGLIAGLAGTHIEVNAPDSAVLVRVI